MFPYGNTQRQGKRWFVSTASNSPAGSDSNSGTIASPFLTLKHADGVVSAGDVVVMRNGTYNLNASVTYSTNGSAGKPIVFMSYPGETAALDGGTASTTADIGCGNWKTWYGITIQNVNHGLYQIGINNVVYNRCTINNTWNQALYFDGSNGQGGSGAPYTGNSHDCRVIYCTVTNNNLRTQGYTGSGGYGACMNIVGSDRFQLIGCTIDTSYADGIIITDSDSVVIKGNSISNGATENVYVSRCSNAIIDSNLIYSNKNVWTGVTTPRHSDGINWSNDTPTSRSITSTNVLIINNCLIGCARSMFQTLVAQGGNLVNSTIAYNTLVNPTGSGFTPSNLNNDGADTGPPTSSGNVFQNNIFYRSTAGTNQAGTWTGFTGNHNNWFNGAGSSPLTGTGDLNATNPNLVSPGTTTIAACQPQAGSPVLGAGSPVSGVTWDINNQPRSATTPSIGAWENHA